MEIFGKQISSEEIQKKIGDISQLGGVKHYELTDGVSRGVRAIDVKSPCGIDFTVLPDRGMGISNLSYKSIPIAWKSATRETSLVYYESKGIEWLRTFYGGLLTTCGLTSIGYPSEDNGEKLGLHGRIANIAAENVIGDGCWEGSRYKMWVQGRVREARVYGDKLELTRKITTWMDEPKIFLEDSVTNIGNDISPLMLLYHVNIGFPVLDENSIIIEDETKVAPMDNEAKQGYENFYKFGPPVKGYKEKCYLHEINADSDGYSNIAIVNEDFNNKEGIGIWLRFRKDTLPYLFQWKNMGIGEYACGIEPCNCATSSRKGEREKGTLKLIEPGETIKFFLEFNILRSNSDIESFKNFLKNK